MEAIYFPFTHVTDEASAVLQLLFHKTVVYRPTERIDAAGATFDERLPGIEFRQPVACDPTYLRDVIKGYEDWAALHQKSGLAMLKAQPAQMPFYGETSTSHIRDEIRQGLAAPAPEGADSRPLLNAMVFLLMAEAFDAQQSSLDESLKSHGALETQMFENLIGDADDHAAAARDLGHWSPSLPGEYMMPERLRAWSLLRRNDPSPSVLHVTTSRAAIEWIADQVGEMEKVLEIVLPHDPQENMHLHEALRQKLMSALESPQSHKDQDTTISETPQFDPPDVGRGSFTCYRLPTLSVHGMCLAMGGTSPAKSVETLPQDRSGPTLVGHIDYKPLE